MQISTLKNYKNFLWKIPSKNNGKFVRLEDVHSAFVREINGVSFLIMTVYVYFIFSESKEKIIERGGSNNSNLQISVERLNSLDNKEFSNIDITPFFEWIEWNICSHFVASSPETAFIVLDITWYMISVFVPNFFKRLE